ncbi:hypothetical protein K443DRAFT_597310 [Laccaria amethystina LaAM-08-1]|uniref:Uncharacterized protein n=1 Tax=Laccaria amethystina LaAM-08-1 TaxID=1095629 RepID=A0A0C9X6K1_9AGAR|nr:hypothetical protein K443DRAFT_597310 [Laccaria amethystina LaAM-08-1]
MPSPHTNLVSSQSSGKSRSLGAALPTAQRRRGNTLLQTVIRCTSDRDARVFASQKTNVAQDIRPNLRIRSVRRHPRRDLARSRSHPPQHNTLSSRRHRN